MLCSEHGKTSLADNLLLDHNSPRGFACRRSATSSVTVLNLFTLVMLPNLSRWLHVLLRDTNSGKVGHCPPIVLWIHGNALALILSIR